MAEAFGAATVAKQVEALTEGLIDLQHVIDDTETNQPGFLKNFKELAESGSLQAAQLRNELLAQGFEVGRLDRIMAKANETGRAQAEVAGGTSAIIAGQYNPAVVAAVALTKDWTGKEDELKEALAEFNDVIEAGYAAVTDGQAGWRLYVESLTDAEGAAQRLRDELFGMTNAQSAVSDAFVELARATKENGASLDVHTEAGRGNAAMLQDLIGKSTAWIGRIYEAEGASQNFADAHAAIRTQLDAVLRSLGYNDAAIATYIALWDQVPREVETNVTIKISTVFAGASKGEEQKYFDEVAASLGEATPEQLERLKANLYDLTPPADTKAKTAKEITDWVDGIFADVENALVDTGSKAGAAGGKALADGIVEEIEWNSTKVYDTVDELNADLIAFMVAGGEDMMDAYGQAVEARVASIVEPLAGVGQEIISQVRYDLDTLEGLFAEFAKVGGSQLGPKSADIAAQAKGFAAGATLPVARERVATALGAGLITGDQANLVIYAIIEMFLEQLNRLPADQAQALWRAAELQSFIAYTPSTDPKANRYTRSRAGYFDQGGINPGIYDTITFAEPTTGGEAYIPLGLDRRARATAVLGDVASRFGYSLIARNATPLVSSDSPLANGSLERIATLLETLPERLPRPLSVTAPIDNVSYGDRHDVAQQVVQNVTRTLAGIGASVSMRQGRR
jgi:RNAse (barnase) inhibitor barstar